MRVYGESDHQIDDKGRINIPKRFQGLFEHGGFLTRAFNGRSLVFYSYDAWEEVQQRLASIDFTQQAADDIARYLSCGTEARLDGQGRLSIPPNLRRRGSLVKDVTLIGMGDKVEVWDTDTWYAYDEANLTPQAMGNALHEIGSRHVADA